MDPEIRDLLKIPLHKIPGTGLELHAPSKAIPGESLDVEVSLQPDQEIKARQVRVELIGEEAVYRSGGKEGARRRIDTFTRVRSVLQGECILHEGTRQHWTTSVQVPTTAPPTCKGNIAEVNWVLRAILDIPRREDGVKESPLEVLATALGARGDKGIAERTFKQCVLGLEFPKEILAGEGQIEGKLRLTVTQPFDLRGIRIELVPSERAGDKSAERVYLEQDVEGPVSFSPPESRSYDFSMASPPSHMVTMKAYKSHLIWLVRATLDRRWRTDLRVEGTVHVHNAQ